MIYIWRVVDVNESRRWFGVMWFGCYLKAILFVFKYESKLIVLCE